IEFPAQLQQGSLSSEIIGLCRTQMCTVHCSWSFDFCQPSFGGKIGCQRFPAEISLAILSPGLQLRVLCVCTPSRHEFLRVERFVQSKSQFSSRHTGCACLRFDGPAEMQYPRVTSKIDALPCHMNGVMRVHPRSRSPCG